MRHLALNTKVSIIVEKFHCTCFSFFTCIFVIALFYLEPKKKKKPSNTSLYNASSLQFLKHIVSWHENVFFFNFFLELDSYITVPLFFPIYKQKDKTNGTV